MYIGWGRAVDLIGAIMNETPQLSNITYFAAIAAQCVSITP
jgi:hypothetical protein